MLLGCYVCLFLITVFLHIYSWWAAIKTRACFEMLGCVLWWMLKKKERNSLQIIWKFLFVFFKNIKCWHWGEKIAAIFWKVFLNVILEQNNKAIKARNVCIANHHILSLHPQMQCQPLAWKLTWGSFRAWAHLRWRPSGKLSSSLTNQNLKFYLTVKDAEEKQSLVISLQFKVYIMIVWGGGGCLCTLNE